jgi:hypothetical protein
MSDGERFIAHIEQRAQGNDSSTDLGFPPALRDTALYGLAGKFVKVVAPHTEADPVAVLVQLLLAFGNACGRGPGFRAESKDHGTNEYVAIVGRTGRGGRKGSSWAQVQRGMRLVDHDWEANCIRSGIASGEGLIHAVRDPVIERRLPNTNAEHERAAAEPDGRIPHEVDPGVTEKRLLVVEEELTQVFRVMQRQGNIVSTTLRQLWEHGNAGGMSKGQPERTTGSLVTLIGHITPHELSQELTNTEAANGFGNRWLWLYVVRSQKLPHGGDLRDDELEPVATEIREALTFARQQGILGMTEEAREAWEHFYYSLDDTADDLFAAITARAEPHVRRLAVLYALLDCSQVVELSHLHAAIAVWDYCEASAAHIFGGKVGEPLADKIMDAITEAGDSGLSRTAIRSVVGGHVPGETIDQALRLLWACGRAHERTRETRGRPERRWYPGAGVKGGSSEKRDLCSEPHEVSSGSEVGGFTPPPHGVSSTLHPPGNAGNTSDTDIRTDVAEVGNGTPSVSTAERIRAQMRHVPCTCATPAELDERGRCSRCWGWPT